MQTYEKLAYEADSSQIFQGILESSKTLREALASLSNAPTTNCNILITGETGTGKELVARVIHRWSHRSPGAFVRLNCAAIQPQLIASELFGPRKGSHSPRRNHVSTASRWPRGERSFCKLSTIWSPRRRSAC